MIVPGCGGVEGSAVLRDEAEELARAAAVDPEFGLIVAAACGAGITGLDERLECRKGVFEWDKDSVVDGGDEVARLKACLMGARKDEVDGCLERLDENDLMRIKTSRAA